MGKDGAGDAATLLERAANVPSLPTGSSSAPWITRAEGTVGPASTEPVRARPTRLALFEEHGRRLNPSTPSNMRMAVPGTSRPHPTTRNFPVSYVRRDPIAVPGPGHGRREPAFP